MTARSQVSFEKVDIGEGPVDFPEGATHWHEVEVYEEEGTVLVGFEHHKSDDDTDDDERGGFA